VHSVGPYSVNSRTPSSMVKWRRNTFSDRASSAQTTTRNVLLAGKKCKSSAWKAGTVSRCVISCASISSATVDGSRRCFSSAITRVPPSTRVLHTPATEESKKNGDSRRNVGSPRSWYTSTLTEFECVRFRGILKRLSASRCCPTCRRHRPRGPWSPGTAGALPARLTDRVSAGRGRSRRRRRRRFLPQRIRQARIDDKERTAGKMYPQHAGHSVDQPVTEDADPGGRVVAQRGCEPASTRHKFGVINRHAGAYDRSAFSACV